MHPPLLSLELKTFGSGPQPQVASSLAGLFYYFAAIALGEKKGKQKEITKVHCSLLGQTRAAVGQTGASWFRKSQKK